MAGPPQKASWRLDLASTRIAAALRSSPNLGLVLLAAVVGLVGGAGAIGFRALIAGAHRLFFGGGERLLGGAGDLYVIPLPAVGLVVVTLLVRRFASEARGHGVPEVQYAVRRAGGRIRARVAIVKALASAICIGSGGSVGREGPIVQIGSSVGSAIGSALGLRADSVRVLLACGAAAGIGGTFNAPIAGVLFAMEVILGSFTGRSFGLIVIASVSATALVQSVLGREPALALREVFTLASPLELPLYLGLGVVCGALSVLWVRAFYAIERLFQRWNGSPYVPAVVGGLAVGLIGWIGIRFLGGPSLFGVGYDGVQLALGLGSGSAALGIGALLALAGLKVLATSTTLAAGGSGGVFAPSLYMGAMVGGAFGLLANQLLPDQTAAAGAYALVGMGALFAAAAHAPITSILILFEMTDDYEIILPLMLAAVVSHQIASWLSPDSIYTTKLRHLGGLSPLQAARRSVLDLVLVADAMQTDVESVRVDTAVASLARRFRERRTHGFPVVDDGGALVGLITVGDVQSALIDGSAEGRVAGDVMTPAPLTCTPQQTLRTVIGLIGDAEVEQVPVVDPERPGEVRGMLGREQILWAVGEMASEHARLFDRLERVGPSRDGAVEVIVEVAQHHADLCFRRLRELRLPDGCLVTTLRRAGALSVPNGDTMIEPGDALAFVTTHENESALKEWVSGLGPE